MTDKYIEGVSNGVYETITVENFNVREGTLTIRKKDLPELVKVLNQYWEAHKEEYPDDR